MSASEIIPQIEWHFNIFWPYCFGIWVSSSMLQVFGAWVSLPHNWQYLDESALKPLTCYLQEGASSNDVITAKFHLVILLTCLIQCTENPTVEVLHCSTLRSLLEHCCVLARIKRYLKTYITICSKMLK